MRLAWLIAMTFCAPLPALAACPTASAPVVSLNYESRYAADDPTRSEIDKGAETEVKEALGDLDGFIGDLTQRADDAVAARDAEAGACVMAELAHWAAADALSDLGSETVELTIAARLAALALVAAQVAPAARAEDTATVTGWLARRMDAQMTFWETAPDGAASGNLRAWAALAGAAVALLTDDPVTKGWAAWSLSYVACSANAAGALPQEMRRKHLALHYQLHAVTPLSVAAALLEKQGIPVLSRCDGALDRIVAFTLRDLAAGGAESAALAGEAQTLNAGVEGLKDFQLAWVEAWLALHPTLELEAIAAPRRPLRYSKLGGDQTRIWQGLAD